MLEVDYLRQAYAFAEKNSTDKSTWNGAIIVPSKGYPVISHANCFPQGVHDLEERHQRPKKYAFVEHAERNAIYEAARRGIMIDGATMYACWFACADCARAIIQSGITRVVGHRTPIHQSRPDWAASVADGIQMLKEAGVRIAYLEEELGIQTLFNGKMELV